MPDSLYADINRIVNPKINTYALYNLHFGDPKKRVLMKHVETMAEKLAKQKMLNRKTAIDSLLNTKALGIAVNKKEDEAVASVMVNFIPKEERDRIFKKAKVLDLSDKYRFELMNGFTDEEHRRKGLFTSLTDRLLKLRREKTPIFAKTHNIETANRLMTGFRFQPIGDYQAKGETVYLLGLS